MKKVTLVILFSTLAITACKDKVYDEAYYTAHPDKMQDVVSKCENGEMAGDNCKNAQTASMKNKGETLLNKAASVFMGKAGQQLDAAASK